MNNKKHFPLVSIIIPLFNGTRYIAEALDSITCQTYPALEILIIDDGSTDNPKGIIDRFRESSLVPVEYFYQDNRGPNTARNTGIKKAKGDFIAFLDADDIWLPEKISTQMDFFSSHADVAFVGCGFYLMDEVGKDIKIVLGTAYTSRNEYFRELRIHSVPTGSSSGVIIKKKCFEKIGLFDETLRGAEDRDMWFRISQHYEMRCVRQPFIKIRMHAKNSHKDIPMMKSNQKMFIKKHIRKFSMFTILKAFAYVYLDAAQEYYAIRNKTKAALNALYSVLWYPFKIYSEDDKYRILIKSLVPDMLTRNFRKDMAAVRRKITVMHLVSSLDIGGLENGIVNVSNNIDQSRFETIICCIKKEGSLQRNLNPEIRVICLHEKHSLNIYTLVRLGYILRKNKVDILHTHGIATGLIYGVLAGKLTGVPYIINGEHGTIYADNKVQIIAQRFLFMFVDKIVAMSKNLKNDLISTFGLSDKKITVVYNGLDIERFKPNMKLGEQGRREIGINDGEKVIGSVGRLIHGKDYKTFLLAAKLLLLNNPLLRFVIVGNGSVRKDLEIFTEELGIEKNVIFTGERFDIPKMLNLMDFYVSTSLDEGLSNTILEALAAGKPIIATNVGGTPEIIKDGINGFLIQPKDEKRLSHIILELLSNKELFTDISAAACQSVRDNFSLSRMVTNYEDLYKEQFS